MGATSNIEWTDASWTPIRARNKRTGKVGWHCEHATTGCINCYSEKLNERIGTGLEYKPGHKDEITIFLDDKMLLAPLRWKKPRMIFVCSMTDLFADFVPDEWIDRMFAVMALCPQHTFQVLTKRAGRMRDWFARTDRADNVGMAMLAIAGTLPHGHRRVAWPLPNVWLGVSAERQEEADARIPDLLQTPATIRFVSLEPLLGPIDLMEVIPNPIIWGPVHGISRNLDWVIIGGESGPGARTLDLAWVQPIVTQCAESGTRCFVKQLGAKPVRDGKRVALHDRKGGDPAEWPDTRLIVRQMPDVRA